MESDHYAVVTNTIRNSNIFTILSISYRNCNHSFKSKGPYVFWHKSSSYGHDNQFERRAAHEIVFNTRMQYNSEVYIAPGKYDSISFDETLHKWLAVVKIRSRNEIIREKTVDRLDASTTSARSLSVAAFKRRLTVFITAHPHIKLHDNFTAVKPVSVHFTTAKQYT